jgi:ferritin
MKFAKYLQDQGAKVELAAIAAPKTEWKDLLEMFKDALAHEKKVTAWISDIMTLAVEEKDYATQNMLKWFIDEQVEEEAAATDVIWMLEMSAVSKARSSWPTRRSQARQGLKPVLFRHMVPDRSCGTRDPGVAVGTVP